MHDENVVASKLGLLLLLRAAFHHSGADVHDSRRYACTVMVRVRMVYSGVLTVLAGWTFYRRK